MRVLVFLTAALAALAVPNPTKRDAISNLLGSITSTTTEVTGTLTNAITSVNSLGIITGLTTTTAELVGDTADATLVGILDHTHAASVLAELQILANALSKALASLENEAGSIDPLSKVLISTALTTLNTSATTLGTTLNALIPSDLTVDLTSIFQQIAAAIEAGIAAL